MKPKKLIIEGLNSFVEKQDIDFETLTSRGLFGIFGATGSGKSTILDAITLALYGEIPRDSREFINTNCKGLTVYYEFEIGVGTERKNYCVYRAINKDSKGLYKLKTCRLSEIDNGIENVVSEGAREVKDKVIEIIGLTSQDFTRSVVLPQGKFNDFLKLSGSNRRDMLERIFGLEKYGRTLGVKVKKAKRKNLDMLTELQGRNASYEERGIKEERYKELNLALKDMIKKEEKLKAYKETLDKEYDNEKAMWDIQKELIQCEKEYDEILKDKDKIEDLRTKYQWGKKSFNVKSFIDILKATEKEVTFIGNELSKNKSELKKLQDDLEIKEKEYKELYNKKEIELPNIIEKEGQLKRAKELLVNKNNLEKDIGILRDNFSILRNCLKEQGEKLKVLKDTIIEEEKSKENIDKLIEENSTNPEYRAKVYQGASIEKDKARLKKEKEELLKENMELEEDLNKRILKNQELSCKYKEDEMKLYELNDRLLQIKNNEIQYKEEVLVKHLNDRNLLNANIELIKEKSGKIQEDNKSLSTSKGHRDTLDNDILQSIEEIETYKTHIEALKKNIDELRNKNMAAILRSTLTQGEPCPVCGSSHHILLPKEHIEDVSALEDSLKERELHLSGLEDNLRAKELKRQGLLSNIDFLDNEIKDINNTISHIGALEDLENQFQLLSKDIENFKTEKTSLETQRQTLEADMEEIKNHKNLIDKEISSNNQIIDIDKTRQKDICNKATLVEDALVKFHEQLDNISKELLIYDFPKEEDSIKNKDVNLQNLHKSLKEKEEALKSIKANKEKLEETIKEKEKEKSKTEETGVQLSKQIKSIEEEIEKLTEGRELQQYFQEITLKKENLIEREEKSRKNLEEEKESCSKFKDKVVSLSERNATLIEVRAKQEKDLEKALSENDFENSALAESLWLPKEQLDMMETKIEAFDDKAKELTINITALKEKLQGTRLDEEKWKELLNQRQELKEQLEALAKDIGIHEGQVNSMKKDLESLKEIKAKLKDLEHLNSNLEDLAKLIEGNKFVEFVAQRHLKYICLEASRRLKDITNGRYALEIDDVGTFIMRDDFNGGSRRATSTLSGGETFLTSLSLALALSSQIQLKGSAPLEFFFLDEGFGTLDSELLDTVMDSLEKLHSKRLSVGIISHVEELKTRVPIKLIIEGNPRDGKGSMVKIDLS